MEFCTWTICGNETGQWNTDCGQYHNIAQRVTPIEHGFRTCPYCSRPLRQNTNGYIPDYDHYNRSHRLLAEKFGT